MNASALMKQFPLGYLVVAGSLPFNNMAGPIQLSARIRGFLSAPPPPFDPLDFSVVIPFVEASLLALW